MKTAILPSILAACLASCVTLPPRQMTIHAPVERVRDATAAEMVAIGGAIVDDSRYSLTARVPQPMMATALTNIVSDEWTWTFLGTNPTQTSVAIYNEYFNGARMPGSAPQLPAVWEGIQARAEQ